MPESRTSSKRRRIFLLALAALAVVAAASFLRARSADLAAWPDPAPGVSPEGPARAGPLLDAAACRVLAARLPDPATAPVDAYRRFQTDGAAALSEADNAAIAARYGKEGGAMDAWSRALAPDGFRNGFSVATPASNLKAEIARVMKEAGYIADAVTTSEFPKKLVITLKYSDRAVPAIREIKRVSRPGLRHYAPVSKIPSILDGMGLVVLSTPKGVMSGVQAKKEKLGGEIICTVA